MKRRALFLGAPFLVLIGVLGCEDTGSVAGDGKPPPSGGGPREIAFIQNMSKQGVCIRAMAVDGSNVETIACHARGQSLLSVSWEPAGTAIAYTINSIPDYGLWRVNADGTNALRLLTPADCPGCGSVAWSPLGQEIAVISNEEQPAGIPQ